MKKALTVIISILAVFMMSGCSNSSGLSASITDGVQSANNGISFGVSNKGSYYEEDYNDYDNYNETNNNDIEHSESNEDNSEFIRQNDNEEKLVYIADIKLEVTDFDTSVALLDNAIKEFSGILESKSFTDNMPSYIYFDESRHNKGGYKRLQLTVRIKTERYEEFLGRLNEVGHTISSSSYVDNITRKYYDTTAYLESYKNQLKSLQNMYSKAETISEMLEIESRIAQVQGQINSLTTEVKTMDMDVAYSTINLNIIEVENFSETPGEYTELSFLEKLRQRFEDSWFNFVDLLENLLYLFIDCMWVLISLALIIVLTIVVIKQIAKRKQIKLEKGIVTAQVKVAEEKKKDEGSEQK